MHQRKQSTSTALSQLPSSPPRQRHTRAATANDVDDYSDDAQQQGLAAHSRASRAPRHAMIGTGSSSSSTTLPLLNGGGSGRSSPSSLSARNKAARNNRAVRMASRFTLLLSICFLAFTGVFVLFPASRERGRAAVDSVGAYAGQALGAAGSGWDKWRQTQASPPAKATAGKQAGSSSPPPSTGGSNSQASVRVLPPQHPDPTKTTRCSQSFDGTRSVVQYAIMIDAGSTGSRVHVYKFNYCSASPELENEVFDMLRPGLSSFKTDSQGAADSLRPLLQKGLDSIPRSLQSCTPIAVKATAGLRLLGAQESRAILSAVRRMIRNEYPFVLADGPATKGVVELTPGGGEVEGKAVEIMEGRDEGVFAWITVNYLLGLIGPSIDGSPITSRRRTAAVMDLGGASTQIVFEPSGSSASDEEHGMRPGEHVYALRNFGGSGEDYVLYQNSYLGYGLMQARRRVNTLAAFAYGYAHPDSKSKALEIPSPCFAPGMSKLTPIAALSGSGSGDVDARLFGPSRPSFGTTSPTSQRAGSYQGCRRLVDVMLDKDADCQAAPCSFAGVYQPRLLDAVKASSSSATSANGAGAGVVALSYFYDRLEPLGLGKDGQPFTLAQLKQVAKDVCSHDWVGDDGTRVDAGGSAARKWTPEALAELKGRPESCLDVVYMHELLSLGYDLDDNEEEAAASAGPVTSSQVSLRIEKKLAGVELGWCLGAAVGMLGEMVGTQGECGMATTGTV